MLIRQFTEEQIMFREAYRRFLSEEVVPHMERFREQGVVDREIFKKAGEQGFLMVWPEERLGGMDDYDIRWEQVIIEELAYARCSDWFGSLHSRIVAPYITRFGTEDQIQRYIPGAVSGDIILAVAMTEPDAGSNLAGMRTQAVEQDDHWILSGQKTYISNGINCDLVVVAAKTDPQNNPHAMTLFLVEAAWNGFERGRNLKKLGLKAQDTAELFFNDVKVPKANVLGEAHKGFYYLMEGLAEERLLGAMGYLAAAQLSWDLTSEFVREREVFGKPLSAMQNTQFKMAELRAELDITQCFVDQAAVAFNAGTLSAEDAAAAKLKTSELQQRVADEGLQLHGGAGFMDEYPISRQSADAKIATIYAGSSEIMKLIIGRHCLGDHYDPFNQRNF
ncbi:MAG: acyl-CoA dehydrogenase [Halieaceae bacterium]|jgi:acyl-CoA dehydrogenase|nr:acyl-CoA dehydrogenase [Halieaceae bacterium]MDG1932224.1 acyl-CoA dehydrogenase family protein [Luminiphilus sp.]MDG2038287.1 acyl-CoA dehydrogenase family protein [Luminiphilus sp.]|tara:strand:+ start:11358 stop:12533 length:1176 start_codon:yes stop_codon:yes gene_type:complete